MDEQTWHARTRTTLTVASLAYIVAYSWLVIADLRGPARVVAMTIVLVTWGMFIADYLVRLGLARDRSRWFRKHLASLAFALIPVLRLVELLRVLTRFPGVKATPGTVLRTKLLVYGAGVTAVITYIASLAVLEAERATPHANITSFDTAVWWSFVTVTTTGYGDYVPITAAGRWVGVGLMVSGVVLVGVITAILASWLLERTSGGGEELATRADVRRLTEQLQALTARDAGKAAAGDDPTSPPGDDDSAR